MCFVQRVPRFNCCDCCASRPSRLQAPYTSWAVSIEFPIRVVVRMRRAPLLRGMSCTSVVHDCPTRHKCRPHRAALPSSFRVGDGGMLAETPNVKWARLPIMAIAGPFNPLSGLVCVRMVALVQCHNLDTHAFPLD